MNLRKRIRELRNLSKIDAYVRPLKEAIDMVAETERERREIIQAAFIHLHNMYCDEPNYDDVFNELEPTFENLVAVYYTIPQADFLRAWTYALSVFNYARAIQTVKKSELPYIG